MRGVRNWWVNVNHIAIVVADIGTSLAFYTDVVGFEQVMRPDFDRYSFTSLIFGQVAFFLADESASKLLCLAPVEKLRVVRSEIVPKWDLWVAVGRVSEEKLTPSNRHLPLF